jgi:hypothetical protein
VFQILLKSLGPIAFDQSRPLAIRYMHLVACYPTGLVVACDFVMLQSTKVVCAQTAAVLVIWESLETDEAMWYYAPNSEAVAQILIA